MNTTAGWQSREPSKALRPQCPNCWSGDRPVWSLDYRRRPDFVTRSSSTPHLEELLSPLSSGNGTA